MKKKITFLILFGVSMFITGVGAAIVINAKDVVYKNNKTVEDTLNDLYSKSNYGDATADDILEGKKALVNGKQITGTYKAKTLTYLGQYTFDTTHYNTGYITYKISATDIANYQDLTADDFYLVLNYFGPMNAAVGTSYSTARLNKSYNASSGELTVSTPKNVYSNVGSWLYIGVYVYA